MAVTQGQHLISEPRQMNLSTGLSWWALIAILPQSDRNPRTVYEIGSLDGPRLSIGIEEGGFRAWFHDSNNRDFSTERILYTLGSSAVVNCELIPGNGTSPRLTLQVDDEATEQEMAEAILGEEFEGHMSIGGNLKGRENAAFQVAVVLLYDRNLKETEKNDLRNHISEKYGL